MDDPYGQCSNQQGTGSHSDDVLLASSCPKKRAGRKKFKETRHPVYRGVRQRNGNRWVCEVRTPVDNSRIWLGSYMTAEMAARAHDVAALALKGREACLNFADSAWRLPVSTSTDTRDIQRAAAEAAEAFRPPELDEPGEFQPEYPAQDDNSNAEVQYNQQLVPQDHQAMNNNYGGMSEMSTQSNVYVDEEAMFNLPSLIDDMAEGLMLPPPSNSWGWDDNENDNDSEVSLWNF